MRKYITSFDTTTEFNGAKNRLEKPNVSLTIDDMNVHYLPHMHIQKVGDIYYSDGTFSSPLGIDTTKTPIGVVVIPNGFLPDGKIRIMSLVEMNYNDPENGGGSSHIGMMWGQYGRDVSSLTNYNRVVTSKGDPAETIGNIDYAYLPSDKFSADGQPNLIDEGTYWYSTIDRYSPSPYDSDGYFNSIYADTNSGSTANCLSDFNGKANTEELVALHTAEDWETATSITNDSGSTYAPAAVCCKRFNAGGRKGQWYLPSMGELGFIMPRFNVINASLANVATALGGSKALQLHGSAWYWSSSEYSSNDARTLSTYGGTVGYYRKDTNRYVRAFLAF